MSTMEYEWAVALIEKIVNDHCEKLRGEAEQIGEPLARKTASEQIQAIKSAFNKVRNG